MWLLLKVGLRPIANGDSKLLLLGSLPGDRSLETRQYYAHPQNQFWKLLSAAFEESIGLEYEERIEFLHRRRLALWDVAESATRPGSLDSQMTGVTVNPIPELLKNCPHIAAIGLNGRKSQQLFEKSFPRIDLPSSYLPSSSPAHTIPLKQKLVVWQQFIRSHLKEPARSAN